MEFNPECVRAILLSVESESDYHQSMHYLYDGSNTVYLESFCHEVIIYHIKQCELSNLIYGVSYCDGGKSIYIEDLTPLGREFLASMKNKTIWKKLMAKCAGASLPILLEIAPKLASEFYLSQ